MGKKINKKEKIVEVQAEPVQQVQEVQEVQPVQPEPVQQVQEAEIDKEELKKRRRESKNNYLKEYYKKNKEEISNKNKNHYALLTVEKLNKGEYKRIPTTRIIKYNIQFNDLTKQYFL